MKYWLKIALCKDTRNSAFRIAIFVGTVLASINYGDRFLELVRLMRVIPSLKNLTCIGLGMKELLKIALTYLVPYCVSTYCSVQSYRKFRNR
ncbi:hypothetical protein B0F88_11153 [Methylobacter tundripaludum]|uniref:Uncharacterized protein n=1 Tax=Methylobacter tundripaludum TaxID=173365 RepID=A0A2S6GTS2_9GAMM|nr:hypothetical protein B0F88_11153 [Methylobacter tundripaludum]